MKISTYNRVSKKEQSRDGDALIRQQWQTDREAKKLDPNYLEFTDVQTGRKDDRPQFQALLRLIESRAVNRVVVTRIDRITRDLESNARMAKLFEKTGVEIFEIQLGRIIDWKNPHDWEYFVRAGVKAESESRMLSSRVHQTFDWLREQGKPAGGGTPLGYCRKDGFYAPDLEKWQTAIDLVKIIIEYRGTPAQAAIAAREIGVNMTRVGLYGWIRLQTIRGHTVYHDEVVYNTHASLFDDPQLKAINALEQVDRIIDESPGLRGKNRSNRQYPLSGLVICGRCGSNCHIKTLRSSRYPDKEYTYIMCGNRQSRAEDCGGEYGAYMGRRGTINTTYSHADALVMEVLRSAAAEIVRRSTEVAAINDSQIEESVEAKELRLKIAHYESLNDPDLAPVIEAKRAQWRELIARKTTKAPEQERREADLAAYASVPLFWELATDAQKRELYQDFVERVICDRSEVIVRLRV